MHIALGHLSLVHLLIFAIGASLTVEAPVSTWQRVDNALASATPAAQGLFRAFKSWLMQQKGEIHLQMIRIGDTTGDVNPLDGVLRLYALYLKKQNTATDAYFKLWDDAANGDTASEQRLLLPSFEALKETILFFPDGTPLALGIAYASETSADGDTGSTTGDSPIGFMLVGA